MTTLPLDPDGRAVFGVLAHALGQPEGQRVLSLAPAEFGLTVASTGAASLVLASLDLGEAESKSLAGNYEPAPPPSAELGDIEMRKGKRGLELGLPGGKLVLPELGGDAIDPAWMWPAATPELEATVRRDALLEDLPGGEGELRYVAADRQLACIAGRKERRLTLLNRPRRRKEISAQVDFDELRLAVAGGGERVTIGVGERRPLTVESGPLRAVLVRAARPWRPAEAIHDAEEQARADAKQADEERRREEERAREARGRALQQAASELDSAGEALQAAASLLDEAGEPSKPVRTLAGRLEKLRAGLPDG